MIQMKKYFIYSFLLMAVFVACHRVPLSNRSQFLLVGDDEMNAMAFSSYKEFLDTSSVVNKNDASALMVKRVGDNIANAAKAYFESVGRPEFLNGYQWQTELINSNQVNAWCMPGGKMVVYTGILPVCANEAGLAVVMGHEVSHAIAKHGAERMSQGMLAQGLLVAGQIGLGVAMKDKPQATQSLWNNVYGLAAPLGAQLGMMAHGRNQESEADHLGLIFMSMAGYNPTEAPNFWKRMAAKSAGAAKPPVWLSTHPSDESRIANINKLMPEAQKYYGKGVKRGTMTVK